MSNIKLVVKSADGVRKTLTPQEFAQFKLQPGMKVMVLDETTGKVPAKMQVKRSGRDLILDVAGESIKLSGFYDAQQVDFLPQGEAPNGVSLSSSAPAPAGTGEALVWSSVPTNEAPVVTGTASTGVGGNWLYAALGGLALAGAGGGGGSSKTVPSVPGTAIDGYLVGAKVYLINGTTKIDTGVLTDANGKFSIQNPNNYTVQIEGGTNSDTGLPNTMVLKAPASASGAFVVTPLTTLIQAVIEKSPAGTTAAQAEAAVSKALGIPSGVDLLTYDPLASTDTQLGLLVQKLAVSVASVVMLADGQAGDVINNIVAGIANGSFSESTPLDLSNASDLTAVLAGVTSVSAEEVTAVVAAIQAATSLTGITESQSAASVVFAVEVVQVAGKNAEVKFTGGVGDTITVSVDKDGTATFSRGGVDAATKVAKFFTTVEQTFNDMDGSANVSLKINSDKGIKLVFNLVDTGAVDHYVVDAPNADYVSFKGDLGSDLGDTVGFKIRDTNTNAREFLGMTVITDNLQGAEKLGFYFETSASNKGVAGDPGHDRVTLTPLSDIDSSVGSDISVVVVRNGAANTLLAQRPAGLQQDLMSDGYVSVEDLATAQAFLSASETGNLIIVLKNADEWTTLFDNLKSNEDLKFIGFSDQNLKFFVGAVGQNTVTADAQSFATLKKGEHADVYAAVFGGTVGEDAFVDKSVGGLPTLQKQIGDLKASIEGGDLLVADYKTILSISTALETLNGLGDGSVSKSISDVLGQPSVKAVMNGDAIETPAVEATGMWADLELFVSEEIQLIQTQINDIVGGDLVANLDTLSELGNAVSSLQVFLDLTLVAEDADYAGSMKETLDNLEQLIYELTADNTAPTAPIVSLQSDTGANNADGITSNGALRIQGLESGAIVEYSSTGEDDSWSGTAPDAVSGSNTIYVRQVDAAENASDATSIQFTLDTTAATISAVTGPADGSYKAGTVIPITVEFSEAVNVTGTPKLTLALANGSRTVNYVSGSGTAILTFNYTVQPGDNATELDATALNLNGGTIKDGAGNQAVLDLDGVNLSGVVIDTIAPNAPTIDTVAGDDVFSYGLDVGYEGASMTITGQGVAGSIITLVRTNATTTVDVDNNWSITVENALEAFGEGSEILAFTQTDAAGNVSQIGTHTISVHLGITGSATHLLSSDIKNTLSGMENIYVTGDTSFKDASSLMKIQNSGTTTFDNIKLTYLQAATLPVDANDIISKITVTGLNFAGQSVLVDLSAYDASTEIWYTGGSADEALMVSASDASGDGRYLHISGGAGNDEVRVVEAFDENGEGITSKITGYLADASGQNDTLTIVGQVDISEADISGFEALQLLNGSPSKITLSASQLSGFSSIAGAGGSEPSVITVASNENMSSVDLTGLTLDGIAGFKLGDNVQLELTADQAAEVTVDQLETYNGETFGGTLSLSGSLFQNLDLTGQLANIDLSGLAGFKVDADGKLFVTSGPDTFTITLPTFASNQKLIVQANQLVGDHQLIANGLTELLVRENFTDAGTVDLRGLSYTLNFDDEATDGSGDINTGVSVGVDTTLIANASQLDAVTVTGDGTVHVHNAEVNDDGEVADTNGAAVSLENLGSDLHVILEINSTAALLNDLYDTARVDEIRLAQDVSLSAQEDSIDGKNIVGDDTNTLTIRDFTGSTTLYTSDLDMQVVAEIRNATDIRNAESSGQVDTYLLTPAGAEAVHTANAGTLQTQFDAVTIQGDLDYACCDFNASTFELTDYVGETVNLLLAGRDDQNVLFLLFSEDGTLRGADSENGPNGYDAALMNVTIQEGDYILATWDDNYSGCCDASWFSSDQLTLGIQNPADASDIQTVVLPALSETLIEWEPIAAQIQALQDALPGDLHTANSDQQDFTVGRIELTDYVGQTVNLQLSGNNNSNVVLLLKSADGTILGADEADDEQSGTYSLLSNITIQEGDYIEATWQQLYWNYWGNGSQRPQDFANDALTLGVQNTETGQMTRIDVPWLFSESPTLTASVDQISDHAVSGLGNLVITGGAINQDSQLASAVDAPDADFSQLADPVHVTLEIETSNSDTNALIDLADLANVDLVNVLDGVTLYADAGAIDAQLIGGNGTVVVVGSADANLNNANSLYLDVTEATGVFTLTSVDAGQTVTMTAGQANDRVINVQSNGTLIVQGWNTETVLQADVAEQDISRTNLSGYSGFALAGHGTTQSLNLDSEWNNSGANGGIFGTGVQENAVVHLYGTIDIPELTETTRVTIYGSHDDGMTLFIDGQAVISDWSGHGTDQWNTTGYITVSPGPHEIEVWYMQGTGGKALGLFYQLADGDIKSFTANDSEPAGGYANTVSIFDGQYDVYAVDSNVSSVDVKPWLGGNLIGHITSDSLPVDVTQLDATEGFSTSITGFQIDDDLSLKLTAQHADGLNIYASQGGSQNGLTIIAGDLSNGVDVDLTAITANLSFDDAEDNNSIELGAGATLTLRAEQADGVYFTGTGTLVISGSITSDVDLTHVAESVTVSFADTRDALETGSIYIQGATLEINAVHASGQTIDGYGEVVVSALQNVTDLSHVDTNLTITAKVADATQISITANNDLTVVDAFVVEGTAELTMTSTQANGRNISGTGTLVLTQFTDQTDLGSVVNMDVGNTVLDVVIQVAADETLNVNEFTNLSKVTGYEVLESIPDGQYINADDHLVRRVDLTELVGKTIDIKLESDEFFDTYLYLRNSDGDEIDSNDDNDLNLNSELLGYTIQEGDYLELAYYSEHGNSQKQVKLTISDADTQEVYVDHAEYTIGQTGLLTINAGLVSGKVLSGYGSVVIQDLAADTDLNQVNPNNSDLSITVTVTDPDLDLSSVFNDNNLGEVDRFDVTGHLTLTAGQADGASMGGSGTVSIKHLENDTNASFEMVRANTVQVQVSDDTIFTGRLGVAMVSVDEDATLTLTAEQASDRIIAGQDATEGVGGSVVITNLSSIDADSDGESDTVYDFTQIDAGLIGGGSAAGTVVVEIGSTQTLNSETLLGGLQTIVQVNDGHTLTLSADQADGRIVNGTGNLVVTDITADTDLDSVVRTVNTLNIGGFTGEFAPSNWYDNTEATIADSFGDIGVVLNVVDDGAGDGDGKIGHYYLRDIEVLADITVRLTFQVTGDATVKVRPVTTDWIPGEYVILSGSGSVDITLQAADFASGFAYLDFDFFTSGVAGNSSVTIFEATSGIVSGETIEGLNSVTATVTDENLDITNSEHLSKVDTFDVKGGAALTLTADQADGIASDGAGTVTVVDLGSNTAADMSLLDSDTVNVNQALGDDPLVFVGDLGNAHLTTSLAQGMVRGQLTLVNADFGPGATFEIAQDTMVLFNAQGADGLTTTGAGRTGIAGLTGDRALDLAEVATPTIFMELVGDTQLTDASVLPDADLIVASTNSNALSIEALSALNFGITGDHEIALGGQASLVLTVDQADGLHVSTLNGDATSGNLVTLTSGLDEHPETDLSHISADLHLTVNITVNTVLSNELASKFATVDAYQVDEDITLMLSADQVSGRDIVGLGDVIVTDLAADTNLDGVNRHSGFSSVYGQWADISEPSSDTVSAVISSESIVLTDTDATDDAWAFAGKTYEVAGEATVRFSYAIEEYGNSYKTIWMVDDQGDRKEAFGFGDNNYDVETGESTPYQGEFVTVVFDSPENSTPGFVTGTITFNVLAGDHVDFDAEAVNETSSTLTLTDFVFVPTVAPAIGSVTVQIDNPELDITENNHLNSVDTYELLPGSGLTLTAAQANGKGLIGTGSVMLENLANGTDLSEVDSTNLSITATVTGTVDLSNNTTDANSDEILVTGITQVVDQFDVSGSLTMKASQASGATATGTGTVTVTDLDAAPGAKLDGLTVDGGITITLVDDTTLTSNATLAHTDLTVEGAYTLDITAVELSNFDLTADDLITVGTGAGLTLNASQADGLHAQGAGTVNVTDLESATDADLSFLNDNTLTVNVSVDVSGATPVEFTGLLGNAAVTVTGEGGTLDMTNHTALGNYASFDLGDGAMLKITAADVDGLAVTGSGVLAIQSLTADIDLQNVITGEQAPVPVSGFTGAFAPDQWQLIQSADPSGTVTFNPAGTELEIHGLMGSGAGDMGSVYAISPTASGSVTFDYIFDQAGMEYFEYYDSSVSENNHLVKLTTSGTGTLTVSTNDMLRLYVGSGDPEMGDPSSSTLTIKNFVYTPAGGGVQGLAAISATVDTVGTLDISENQTGAEKIGTFSISSESTLKLSAAQADGKTINALNHVSGGVALIAGDVQADTDLTNVVTDLSFDDGDETISIDETFTLTLTANQAVSVGAITGLGTLQVKGDTTGVSNLDLHQVTAILAFTNADDEVQTSITVVEAQTLTLDVGQLGNFDVIVNAADETDSDGTLYIKGLNADTDMDGADITNNGHVVVEVTADGETSVTGNTNLDVVDEFIVNGDSTLKLDASLANGRAVTGTGNVHVLSLDETLDANLSLIDTDGSMTADFTANGTFDGNLGNVHVTVSAGVTMTISAQDASGKYISGDQEEGLSGGSIVITGLDDQNDYDLSNISAGGATGDDEVGTVIAQVTVDMTLSASTNLGLVQLQIGDDATITMDVSQADGSLISLMDTQTGHLVLTGDVTEGDMDLTTVSVTSLDFDGGILVADEASLTLTAAQANGQTITGSNDSTVIISGDVLESTTADLRDISQVLSFADAGEVTATIAVEADATLVLNAAQASNKSITGSGDVRVHGLTEDTNLDDVRGVTLTVVMDASDDISAHAVKSEVNAYELSDGVTVQFNADQLNGISVTAQGIEADGVAVLEGDISEGTVDLRSVQAELTLGTDGTIAVAEGAVLQMTGAQADHISFKGYTITGGGTVEVTTVESSGDLNLSGILTSGLVVNDDSIALGDGATLTVNASNFDMAVSKDGDTATVEIIGDLAATTSLDLTGIADGIEVDLLGTDLDAMQLGDGAQLLARAEQLAGESVEGTGTIVLTGDASAGLILSAISVNLDVSGVTGLSLTGEFASTLPQYAVTRTLTLSYAQAPVENYNAGLADVVIKSIESATNADLTFITANSITALADSTVTFVGNFGTAEVSVNDGEVLTTSAGIASGVTIGGLGSLNISGDIAEGLTIDLTHVSTAALTFWDDTENAIDVAIGAVLQINAEMATAKTITGDGTVDVRGALTGDLYNFASITADTSHLTFVDDGLLNAETDLSGVDEITLAEGTTEFSAAQAHGRAFSGLGGVKIHDADGMQTFNGTAFSDTFLGQGSNNDVVDFSKQDGDSNDISGSDTVRFSGAASDMLVIGLTFGALADNSQADVLDFSNLALSNSHASGSVYEQLSIDGEISLPAHLTGYVIGFSDVTAEDARGVANLFSLLSNALNKTVDDNGDMVFLIANSAGDTNVWHWQDVAGTGHGDVQSGELTKLGTLDGVDQTDIANIRENNIHFVV